MQTSMNLKKSDRNAGTVRRVSIRKAFVTFAQTKCSEAKILNDLQPEQRQGKLLNTGFCWQLIRKEDGRIKTRYGHVKNLDYKFSNIVLSFCIKAVCVYF